MTSWLDPKPWTDPMRSWLGSATPRFDPAMGGLDLMVWLDPKPPLLDPKPSRLDPAQVLSNFTIEAVSTEDIPTVFRFILMPEKSPLDRKSVV